MDTRTEGIVAELEKDGGQDRFRGKTGLPLATYFSGLKLKWILDNVDGVRAAAEEGRALFGTVDTWLLWNLTGGHDGGKHLTDVTNASRTMLMNLSTQQWDDVFGVPRSMLPTIVSSSQDFGKVAASAIEALAGVTVAGVLGDQQAALFGQTCFEPGEGKNT